MTFVEWLSMVGRGVRPWVTVKPWEQAVRVRAGKHVRILGPGMYPKIPIIDTATVLPIRRRVFTVSLQTIMSKDRQPVTVGISIGYQIEDVLRVFQTTHNMEGTLAAWSQGVIGKIVRDTNVADIRPELLLEAIREEIRPQEKGLGQFEVYITDMACLPGRTFRLIQEGRWMDGATVESQGREA